MISQIVQAPKYRNPRRSFAQEASVAFLDAPQTLEVSALTLGLAWRGLEVSSLTLAQAGKAPHTRFRV